MICTRRHLHASRCKMVSDISISSLLYVNEQDWHSRKAFHRITPAALLHPILSAPSTQLVPVLPLVVKSHSFYIKKINVNILDRQLDCPINQIFGTVTHLRPQIGSVFFFLGKYIFTNQLQADPLHQSQSQRINA